MAAQKAKEANFLLFRNEADSAVSDEVETEKILHKIREYNAPLERHPSHGYTPDSEHPYDVQEPRRLRKSGDICSSCGCNGSCMVAKAPLVSVSTSIDHFGDDCDLVDPWPKRSLRIDNKKSGQMPTLLDSPLCKMGPLGPMGSI